MLRVDHTFVAADGVRWIVDYKFAEPERHERDEPAALASWLSRQCEQYSVQLAAYRDAFLAHERRLGVDGPPARIITALYFPWLDRLHRCG